jgi:XTP/dITP diphosphohydrolase
MKQIVFATENPGKLHEINRFAALHGYEILSPSQAGFEPVDVEETGSTYEENARLKVEAYLAQEAAKSYVVCGEDAGIELRALGGEPGIHTRRWLGYRMSDDEIIGYALGRLYGQSNRRADFKSTLAYSINGGEINFLTGLTVCTIEQQPFDVPQQEGFPFRSIASVDSDPPIPLWKFDHMAPEERGVLSHREESFKKLFELLDKA